MIATFLFQFIFTMNIFIFSEFRFARSELWATKAIKKFSSYQFRVANKNDIPFIRNCNAANLPENYNDKFYNHQLSTWPQLSLVCEDEHETIIGYALGLTIEDENNQYDHFPQLSNWMSRKKGHVASIAISSAHRGKKLAHNLMDFMHLQFAKHYDVNGIDLYCRVSKLFMYIKLQFVVL